MAHKDTRIYCRVYLLPEQYEHLKSVAKEQGISFSDLMGTAALKKYPPIANDISSELSEQVQLDEPLPEKTEPSVVDVVSNNVDSIKEKESRLREVNRLLNLAKRGERLERDVYFALIEEQKALRAELGHN